MKDMSGRIKLQLFLSRSGACSRRKALEAVKEGRVSVNGRVEREPSVLVDPREDAVSYNGRPVRGKPYAYLVLNKPRGFVTTRRDPRAGRTVMQILPAEFRHLVPAGRLDKDTEGLLLMTNDGDCAYKLTHPKFCVEKTYLVRVRGRVDGKDVRRLETGLEIEGQKTAPARAADVVGRPDSTQLTLTIHEGRKRQVRLMFAALGHPVLYLKRLRQGPLQLGRLKTGQWRLLKEEEIKALKTIESPSGAGAHDGRRGGIH